MEAPKQASCPRHRTSQRRWLIPRSASQRVHCEQGASTYEICNQCGLHGRNSFRKLSETLWVNLLVPKDMLVLLFVVFGDLMPLASSWQRLSLVKVLQNESHLINVEHHVSTATSWKQYFYFSDIQYAFRYTLEDFPQSLKTCFLRQ
jgi:hypothetical protein